MAGLTVRRIREGLIELELPEDPRLGLPRGPQRAGGGFVFYNPAARCSRDLTIALVRALAPPPEGWRFLDGLCGTGVRGLRVAREVEHVAEVVLNDGDPAAAAAALKQARRLALSNVTVENRSLEEALADRARRFDFIDIDPYGSPARFLTAAAARVARRGFVAVSATDLAVLCGVYPQACLRRYGALPLRNEWKKETAARILLGAAARAAGTIDRGIEPVLTVSKEHYIRAIYRVTKSTQAADRTAQRLGYLLADPAGRQAPAVVFLPGLEGSEPHALAGRRLAGPLWVGDLHDAALLGRAQVPEWIDEREGLERLLATAAGEVGLPPYHFSLDEAARALRGSPPPTSSAVEELRRRGFRAARTHFDTKGVKTDASPAELRDAVAFLTRSGRHRL